MYKVGLPVTLRVNVDYDKDAKVFTVTSNDLRALVVEASTTDELIVETKNAVDMLMEDVVCARKAPTRSGARLSTWPLRGLRVFCARRCADRNPVAVY
ncbi:DUF1902 domain-containing protein [Alcaligenaceae bacterium CGII-47]|nr:DUF1902 domain-containing protein [Alcaligenaceae bacterium CGII-47]